ncbi:Holliday junction ATP-dependent DNA helicase RuvA [Marmoricola endophyticus]|uniref:Holliday junction branch migration complex subunit RuvA n=1 Tax=Marmoricola endophyticus TaxID=2040280 RepID=A0A917BFF2_9ACTN|nr:Holliday junction branch migration protein RuvA [Marmoricola endophyticus]GGF36189.1 Holliday junction ATP-dependent DNA helicase RuvA [Marmoricola endophyticus]
MIASLTGTVAVVRLTSAVLVVGGVGLEVQCTPRALADLRTGQTATLATSLVVREDSLTLFGFGEDDEKQTFELLLTASGVGPRIAQAMLAVHTPDALRAAVGNADLKTLTAVPGIGQKGAQRIVLELKDKIGAPTGAGPAQVPTASAADWEQQVHTGLVGLGWSAKEADKAVSAVAPMAEETAPERPDVAALLRAALQSLSRS